MSKLNLSFLLAAACACATPPAPTPAEATADAPAVAAPNVEPVHASDGATGVEDPALAALLIRSWERVLVRAPEFATQLGDHRYDDRVHDASLTAREEDRAQTRAELAEAKAISEAQLSGTDRITRALFIEKLESAIASDVCEFDDWTVSPRSNPITDWGWVSEMHQVITPKDGMNLVARLEKAPQVIDDELQNLARGADRGWFTNRETARRVVEQFELELAKPTSEWGLAGPAKAPHPDWSAEDLEAFRQRYLAALEKGLRPAFARYLELVKARILPKARDEANSGLGALPFGAECYQARVRNFTTLELTAKKLHETGLAEIARLDREIAALGKKALGTKDLAATLAKLRSDPKLRFDSAEAIQTAAEAALAKAKAKMTDSFGILPKAECVVQRIPDYEAPFTTIAYYRQPAPDGSKPGEYFINVYEPTTRPKFEMEVLTFHESIPGHHLQIAIAQELPELPAFRKHLGMTAFVEGWALYTEQLAEEMGLYSSDLSRLGMLSFDAWRASRLVVDTGIHAMGWSRERAKKFMLEHTALAANNIDNEVDRYIVWPAQALAYKTGQMEIWRLRRSAEKALGGAFDLKEFHDVVLGRGAVTLPVLGRQVDAWVQARAQKAQAQP